MHIQLSGTDEAVIQAARVELYALLGEYGMEETLTVSPPVAQKPGGAVKGDSVTIFTVLLAAVGAGGALTVAMSKEGFLTRLARVLETLADRKVSVTLEETPDGRRNVSLSGSARQVERMLGDYLAASPRVSAASSESPEDKS